MDAFKKRLDELVGQNGTEECMFEDIKLSLVKDADSDFPNLKIINDLLPTQFPVIVAHKPFNRKPVTPLDLDQSAVFRDNVQKEQRTKKISDRSDVEGSPLKLQVYVDTSAFSFDSMLECTTTNSLTDKFDPEELKFGIPLGMARKFISQFNIWSKFAENSNVSFLCFCDGNDRKRTACIYTESVKSKEICRGIKSSIVYVYDPVNNNEHFPNLHRLDLSRKQISYRATYDILYNCKEENVGLTDTSQYRGSLILDVSWFNQQKNVSLLCIPPPDAITTIKANAIPGSQGSATYGIYQELMVLNCLIEGLQSSEVTWLTEGKKKINVMKSLKDLFEYLKLGDAALRDKTKENDADDVAARSLPTERDNFDFTDHLWKVLHNSTSFQDLTDCLKHVFTVLSNGELQPMVRRYNETMIAQLVRDSFSKRLRIPNLAGWYPVELLVEIGIEKLKQDYKLAFLSKDLATQESLDPFLKPEGGFASQFIQLEKMHYVMEMVSMLQYFLKIPVQNLSTVAREMLNYYERNLPTIDHIFKFIIPTGSVIKNLETNPPSSWQVESTKFIENVKESTVFLLTLNPPFKHLSVSDNTYTKEDESDTRYMKDDETFSSEKIKRSYFFVRKVEGISILT